MKSKRKFLQLMLIILVVSILFILFSSPKKHKIHRHRDWIALENLRTFLLITKSNARNRVYLKEPISRDTGLGVYWHAYRYYRNEDQTKFLYIVYPAVPSFSPYIFLVDESSKLYFAWMLDYWDQHAGPDGLAVNWNESTDKRVFF